MRLGFGVLDGPVHPPVGALVLTPRLVELLRCGAVESFVDADDGGLTLPAGGLVPRRGHSRVTGGLLVGAVRFVADARDVEGAHGQLLFRVPVMVMVSVVGKWPSPPPEHSHAGTSTRDAARSASRRAHARMSCA